MTFHSERVVVAVIYTRSFWDRFRLNAHLIVYWLIIGGVFPSWVKNIQFYNPCFRQTAFCKVHTEDRTTRCQHPAPIFIHFFLSQCPFPPYWSPISFHFLLGVGPHLTFQPRHATCHSTKHTHTHTLAWAWCKRHVTSVLSLVGSSCPRPHPRRFQAPGREEGRLYDKGTQ